MCHVRNVKKTTLSFSHWFGQQWPLQVALPSAQKMCVVCETNEDSVLEVGVIMFMKLYILSGELHVSLTESGL